jgi:hypothetical protein
VTIYVSQCALPLPYGMPSSLTPQRQRCDTSAFMTSGWQTPSCIGFPQRGPTTGCRVVMRPQHPSEEDLMSGVGPDDRLPCALRSRMSWHALHMNGSSDPDFTGKRALA